MALTNNLVNPLLTDKYQLTAAYAYWKNRMHEVPAVFELFFRKCPFGGEFAICAGLGEALEFINAFRFTPEHIGAVRAVLPPDCDPEFFDWLSTVDGSCLKIRAVREGSVVFPRVPLLQVEGPLAVCQLVETTLLNLINYPSLVATNAARFRFAAGPRKWLIEFGLRRAQGPDGAVSASRYSYLGGFDSTSNVLASHLFGIPCSGTHPHAFVASFSGLGELFTDSLVALNGQYYDFVPRVLENLKGMKQLFDISSTNEGELAAFIAYAQAFPHGFLALVDTYDTLGSGVPNFLAVALALASLGYSPVGVRLDSGDLAKLSRIVRSMFCKVGERFGRDFGKLPIVASNEIDEKVLYELNRQGHSIDSFGIGTRLVTCWEQPAFGAVYKLVEIRGSPRFKMSEERGKATLPGKKYPHRLLDRNGHPLMDVLTNEVHPLELYRRENSEWHMMAGGPL